MPDEHPEDEELRKMSELSQAIAEFLDLRQIV